MWGGEGSADSAVVRRPEYCGWRALVTGGGAVAGGRHRRKFRDRPLSFEVVSDACYGVADVGAGSGARADVFLVAYMELEQDLEWGGADHVSYCFVMLLYFGRKAEGD